MKITLMTAFMERCSVVVSLGKRDSIDVVPQVSRSRSPGLFGRGETVVQYMARDTAGNVAECSISVSVQRQ